MTILKNYTLISDGSGFFKGTIISGYEESYFEIPAIYDENGALLENENIQKTIDFFKQRSEMNAEMIAGNAIYREENPYVFIHNPRTGGTGLGLFLNKCCEGKTLRLPETKTRHSTYTEIFNNISLTNPYVFGFVRNPYAREYSIYSLLVKINQYRPNDSKINLGTSFSDWIINVRDTVVWSNDIIRTQKSYFVDENNTIVANVFKFEDRLNCVETICNNIGANFDQFTSGDEIINSATVNDYKTQYTNEAYDLTTQRYTEDLQTFNYTFESS